MWKSILKKIVVFLLTLEARLVLRKYRPRIVAVTGSVGKTSTKDAIFTALSVAFFARKSEKSYNSEIGVPLTILGTRSGWRDPFKWLRILWDGLLLIALKNHYPKWLVLEVGADRPGDIRTIASWLPVDIVILTKLPSIPVHVEFFESPQALWAEKQALFSALRPGGKVVLNQDDENVPLLPREDFTKLTIGFSQAAAVRARYYHIRYQNKKPIGFSFRVDYQGSSVPVSVSGVLGRQHVYALLAAFAVGIHEGMNLVSLAQALEKHIFPGGRMRILDGVRGSILLDDTYNSSPIAATEALAALDEVSIGGRKIAVFGDMLEIGKYSVDEHRRLGEHAARVATFVVTVGVRGRYIAEGARETGFPADHIFQFTDTTEAGKMLADFLQEGDVALLKASQSIRLEKTVGMLLRDPSQKKGLLVRQGPEWKVR